MKIQLSRRVWKLPARAVLFVIVLLCCPENSRSADLVRFTQEEQQWLHDHPRMTMVVGMHPAPISFWQAPLERAKFLTGEQGDALAANELFAIGPDEQQFFQGVAADYFHEVSRLTGISFIACYGAVDDMAGAMRLVANGTVDLLPTVIADGRMVPELLVTDPYISLPVVIVMRDTVSHLDDISRLQNMTVAGVLSIQAKFDKLGLANHVITVPPREGLMGVATGKFDAFIAELSGVTGELENTPVTNIKIVGELPAPTVFRVGVSPAMAGFVPIFNKAVHNISREQQNAIWRNWFSVTYEQKLVNSHWLWVFSGIGIVSFIVGLVVFFFYRSRFLTIRNGIAELDPHLLCVYIDRDITITSVTQALCETTGFRPEDLVGKPLDTLSALTANEDANILRFFDNITQGVSWKGEVKLVRKDGSDVWMDVTIAPSRRRNDELGFTVMYQDASERKQYKELALRDELTGLFNRRHFNDIAPQLLAEARKASKVFVLLILDVDNFKKYNDNYGHQRGDEVLAALGKSLHSTLQRDDDVCFRLGGEEFGIISILASSSEAAVIAEKIRLTVSKLNIEHSHNPPGKVTVSIGGAISDGSDAPSLEKLYRRADANLYRAKTQGRNRFVGDSSILSQ